MGRPRSAGRRDLPPNLVPRYRRLSDGRTVTYWYWRDPRDGKEKALRCPGDRATAVRRAQELNALVAREEADTLVAELGQSPAKRVQGTPFNAFAAHCLAVWEKRGLAANTLRMRKSHLNVGIRHFGERPLHEIEVSDMVQLLEPYLEQEKNRTAQSIRTLMIDVWKEAQHEGLLPPNHPNPAQITRRPKVKVRRTRLTLDAFHTILKAAEALGRERGAWVPNSLLLGLVTAQRREDLVSAQFRRGQDWEKLWVAFQEGDREAHPYPFVEDGMLWVAQQKTGALVQIPLGLRLEALDLSVGEVIEQCRSRVASRYLLHHTKPYGNAPRGSRVHKDSISRAFAEARECAAVEWPAAKDPPTYHELRSLAERLYKAQGVDTQALLGHKHARMTSVYHDPRQAEWAVVRS